MSISSILSSSSCCCLFVDLPLHPEQNIYQNIVLLCWNPKLAKADMGQAYRLDWVPGRFDRVSCSRSGTKGPGGLTAPRVRSNWVTPISGRIRSLAWFWVVKCNLQGKTSDPINIKGRGRLRPITQSNISILSYFLQTLAFPTSIALLLRLHSGWGSSEWPADLRTTLGALFPTGSLPEQRI
jgi:hypothetical protein